ncbi:GFA family protein [Sphingomonas sp. HF-S4]|uniref:GFA family protein n=1 Tax=Sphingomonas agrestis TaxID=3080540 RepID=A0ABU3Y676_9SPHN|nr:GFA family protein [Sphingomonas sp. HF-S4]MDV3456794.1 GFA family protein [Sphingomonas sp. HF-S4]
MTSAPIFVNGCHCRVCQRETGSAFAINAMIEADRIEMLTETMPERYTVRAGTQPPTRGARCPRCAVALWGTHPDFGEAILFVRGGTLDERVIPDAHFFTVTRHPLVTVPDDVQSFAGLPTAEDWPIWNVEVQARIDAAMAARLPEA